MSDDGAAIASSIVTTFHERGSLLPAIDTIERIGLAGRAIARRRAERTEPRRVCRRLQLLSRMEHHEQDNERRVVFVECKSIACDGQIQVRSLDQTWRVSSMRQRDRDAATKTYGFQCSVDFGACAVLHRHENMGARQIGF